jgi:hypothetical protein
MRNAYYYVGTPAFSLTVHLSATMNEAICPNPTGRAFVAERTATGETFVWFGERLCIVWTPRKLCVGAPLLIFE